MLLDGLTVSVVGVVFVFLFLGLLVGVLWLLGRVSRALHRPSERREESLGEVAAVLAIAFASRRGGRERP